MKNQWLTLILISCTLFVLLILRLWYSIDRPVCGKAIDFYKRSLNSIVIDKYIDYEDHGRLILKLNNDEKELGFVRGNREAILYDRSAIGDSIKKNFNSSFTVVKRGGKLVFSDNIFFYRCDSTELVTQLN